MWARVTLPYLSHNPEILLLVIIQPSHPLHSNTTNPYSTTSHLDFPLIDRDGPYVNLTLLIYHICVCGMYEKGTGVSGGYIWLSGGRKVSVLEGRKRCWGVYRRVRWRGSWEILLGDLMDKRADCCFLQLSELLSWRDLREGKSEYVGINLRSAIWPWAITQRITCSIFTSRVNDMPFADLRSERIRSELLDCIIYQGCAVTTLSVCDVWPFITFSICILRSPTT